MVDVIIVAILVCIIGGILFYLEDDPESLYAAGIDYAVQQLRDLIEGGADGVHLYAMNDAKVAAAVYEGIKDLL